MNGAGVESFVVEGGENLFCLLLRNNFMIFGRDLAKGNVRGRAEV